MTEQGLFGPSLPRSWYAAPGIAILLFLSAGVAFRGLSDYLTRPVDSVPLPAGALDRIPLEIGGWVGKDVPLDEQVIQATDTDALINRRYAARDGSGSVGLYVAYGIRGRDLAPHRPEVCYPGSGWTPIRADDVNLPLRDGVILKCRVLRFSRSGLDIRRIVVVNYYIVDGEPSPDVELLRSKIWRGSTGIRYMAQVQLVCSTSPLVTIEIAERQAIAFAAESAAAIEAVLPRADDPAAASADSTGDSK